MKTRTKKLKPPAKREIAGWYLGSTTQDLEDIASGRLTVEKAKKVRDWVIYWARWVAQEESKVRRKEKPQETWKY